MIILYIAVFRAYRQGHGLGLLWYVSALHSILKDD